MQSTAVPFMLIATVCVLSLGAQPRVPMTTSCPRVARVRTDLPQRLVRDTSTLGRSSWTEREVSVLFVNANCDAVKVEWRDYYGQYRGFGTLAAGDSTRLATYVTHHWVARSLRGVPIALFVIPEGGGRAVILGREGVGGGARSGR